MRLRLSTVVAVFLACSAAPDPPPQTIRTCPVETGLLERFEKLAAKKFDLRIRPDVPAPYGKICGKDRDCGKGAFCVSVLGQPRRVCKKASHRPTIITRSLRSND